jgi:hypothetical protein
VIGCRDHLALEVVANGNGSGIAGHQAECSLRAEKANTYHYVEKEHRTFFVVVEAILNGGVPLVGET